LFVTRFVSSILRLRSDFKRKHFLVNTQSQNLLTRKESVKTMKYLNQSEAAIIDKELFEKYQFSIDQLMELAGQSCAIAIAKTYPLKKFKKILVFCGPGNNGGDGLVCARHLKQFGYSPDVFYPKKIFNNLFDRLIHQCAESDIPILKNGEIEKNPTITQNYDIIVDALFGFSYKPPTERDFIYIIDMLKNATIPICSIDIPSGWDVESGPPAEGGIKPEMLISLTAPKICASKFKGKFHYLGGRFVPKKLELEHDLNLPKYIDLDLVVQLN